MWLKMKNKLQSGTLVSLALILAQTTESKQTGIVRQIIELNRSEGVEMVCEKCELKLKHVATSDPWKMAGKAHPSAMQETSPRFLH